MANKLYITLEVDDKGTKVVRSFDKNTTQAFDNMKKNAKASTSSMGGSLNKLKQHWMAVTAAVGATLYAITKFIDAASNLQEVNSKFNVVFESQIALAKEWAKELVDSYAMSTREAKEYLASTQDLLVPMGMASDKAGILSSEIVKLSADLGSFNNLPTAQVMADIQSALVGNYETMKKYGVVLNATVIQEEALAMGLARTKDALTAADKAQAAYKLMVEGSKAAIGDLARTSDSYANIKKKLKSRIEDVVAALGKGLLPVASDIAERISEWIGENKKLIEQRIPEYIERAVKAVRQYLPIIVDVVRELIKFYAISKAIAGMTAIITFFKAITAASKALTLQTLALSKAMKANLIALAAYAAYKVGEKIGKAIYGDPEKIKEESEAWEAMTERLKTKIDETRAKLDEMTGTQGKLVDTTGKTNDALNDQAGALKNLTDAAQKEIDIEEAAADIREQAAEEMYKEFGIDADAYYRSEVQQLVERAKEWKDAGVDIESINRYLYENITKMSGEAYDKGEEQAGFWLLQVSYDARMMVENFETAQQEAFDRLNELDLKIGDLDGSNIGLTISIYDQASSGIDKIIEKLGALQLASSSINLPSGASYTVTEGGADESGDTEPTGPPEEPQEDSTAAEVAQGGDQEESEPVSGSVSLHIHERLSRSDVANIIVEQDRRAYRT